MTFKQAPRIQGQPGQQLGLGRREEDAEHRSGLRAVPGAVLYDERKPMDGTTVMYLVLFALLLRGAYMGRRAHRTGGAGAHGAGARTNDDAPRRISISTAAATAQPPAQVDAAPAQPSHEDRLRELADLQAQGLISDQEYAARRQQILDSMEGRGRGWGAPGVGTPVAPCCCVAARRAVRLMRTRRAPQR